MTKVIFYLGLALLAGGNLVAGGLAAIGLIRMNKNIPKEHSLNRNVGLGQLLLGAALLLMMLDNIDNIQSVIAKSASVLLCIVYLWAYIKTAQDIREYQKQQSKDKANTSKP